MDQHTKSSTPSDGKSLLGITFDDVRSDEPHEEIVAKRTETEKVEKPRQSHLSNSSDVFDVTRAFENEHIETGTILSDRRRHKASLTEELGSAFHEWWNGTKKSVNHALEAIPETIKTEAKPVVAKAEARADVVKEAVTYTSHAPKDDHRVVVEKVRTYAHDVEKITGTPLVIKAPTIPAQGAWSHVSEHAQNPPDVNTVPHNSPLQKPDMRESMIAPLVGVHTQKTMNDFVPTMVHTMSHAGAPTSKIASIQVPSTTQRKEIFFPKNTIFDTPVQHAVQKNSVTRIEMPGVKPFVPTPIVEKVAPEPVKHSFIGTEMATATPLPPIQKEVPAFNPPQFRSNVVVPQQKQNVPVVETAPQKTTTPAQAQPPITQSNTAHTLLRYGIFVGIIALGITLAIVASIYFNVFEKQNEPVRETTPTAVYFSATKQTPLLLTGARETFLAELKKVIGETPSLSSVYPTIVESKEIRPATAREILAFIGTHLDEKTVRSLSDTMMIGNVVTQKSEPYLIMQSHSFDTLFAGLLAWELFIYTDFSPLFDTVEAVGVTRFKDVVVLNAPTRILTDEEGRELLHYAVVNQNTVIITTSRTALSELIQKVTE